MLNSILLNFFLAGVLIVKNEMIQYNLIALFMQ